MWINDNGFRCTSKTGAIFVSEPRVNVTSPFDSAVFADCWVVGQFDRFGRSGIRHAFDATYESYDDLSANKKSPGRSTSPGHTKLESTVRYLGIEVDDALEIAEQTEV